MSIEKVPVHLAYKEVEIYINCNLAEKTLLVNLANSRISREMTLMDKVSEYLEGFSAELLNGVNILNREFNFGIM